MTFNLKDGKAIRTLPCGDTVEILPTEEGFNIEVYYFDNDRNKKTVFYRRYMGKELTGVSINHEKT